MIQTAIIGGSGFDSYEELTVKDLINKETPFGSHSGPIVSGKLNNYSCLFLPRHGKGHKLPPHKVNYRANLWALKSLGVKKIISLNVVGGINPMMPPNTLVIPDQIIDYSYGREHTFFDGEKSHALDNLFQDVEHIDFTYPFSEKLRGMLIDFFTRSNIPFISSGTYGCTQGPRLETAAEIQRLKHDGCDLVGMTAMPEAALAKELDIDYAAISIVVNWAAGISQESLLMIDILNTIEKNLQEIKVILPDLLQNL